MCIISVLIERKDAYSGENDMNVTFMIGNGFDLRMGMHTKYTDMYDSYVASDSEDDVIRKFKNVLSADGAKKYVNWGDFELAMAKYARAFETEQDFIKCVRDFKSHMVMHLKKEEEQFLEYLKSFDNSFSACVKTIDEALSNYCDGQTPNVISKIKKIENRTGIAHDFITFNYTRIFDYLLERYKNYHKIMFPINPIHIHGNLEGDVVLGIDNMAQVDKLKYPTTKRFERAFIKPNFNEEYNNQRVMDACNLIKQSDVICVYGMSLGKSDETWINQLSKWLLADENHHLIYYQHSQDIFNSWNSDEKMDVEDERKEILLRRLFQTDEDIETVYDRVHIPIGFDIFDIHKNLKKNNISTMGSMSPG